MNADQRRFLDDGRGAPPTCSQVFEAPQIASDPRHCWRQSVRGWGLAGSSSLQSSAKSTAKPFAADERGSTQIFGRWPGPHPTCSQVIFSPKTASDPRHYWRKSIPGGGLAAGPVVSPQNPASLRIFKDLRGQSPGILECRLR